MKVLNTSAELRAALAGSQSVGFVPTMGALHEGHATLLRQSRHENKISVLSIYVNPTQFGPNEDFSRYPRTLEADLVMAQREGVDFVFCPSNEVMYPEGFSTFVDVGAVAEPLCGRFRPGHFRGVATVVTKLFQLVPATRAYFGQKDLQQCLVIERLVKDLNIPVEIRIVSTVRESDGLAMSSRNRYLSAQERARALVLYQALTLGQKMVNEGERSVEKILAASRAVIDQARAYEVQYLEILSYPDLRSIERVEGKAAFAVAALLGKTRLIDNIILE